MSAKEFTNLQIADLLRNVAAAYQLQSGVGNRFKVVAYGKAADAVEHATSELKDMWDDGKLEEVPGIGPSIAKHLDELFRTGKSKHFDDLMKDLPQSMFEFLKVSGIGPKTAYRLAKELNLKSMGDLENAAKTGKIAKLEGFGEDSQQDILSSIQETKGKVKRHLLPYAAEVAGRFIEYLSKSPDIKRADTLGSLRRKVSTIGDIDLSVSSPHPEKAIEYFINYPDAQRVVEKGTRTAAIMIPGGTRVDLMVETPEGYGSLLQHFTGSKHHNVALRELSLKKGYSLSDYGVKKVGDKSEKLIKFDTEEKLYKFFGLSYIPPELREDTGEIARAVKHDIPTLVELKDIKADLQIHSDFDIETSHDIGGSSMEDICDKAAELGYEYIAFTDHNPSQRAHKESDFVKLIKKRSEKIAEINYSPHKKNNKNTHLGLKKVFNALEIDILPDGRIPVPDSAMELLDFALVSIHSSFKGERQANTKRVLSALSHPKAKIFAHPTGRKLNEREGVDLDWPQIMEFCVKNNKWLEINSDPARLDLPDVLVREAVERGVLLSMGTDSHHVGGMNNMIFGISVARRGWCEAKNIVNTRSLAEFEKLLNR